jgi:hypothetical protein
MPARREGQSGGSVLRFLEGKHGRWRPLLGLDTRSLALFRLFLGLVVIGDVLDRCPFTKAHYSDYGVRLLHFIIYHLTWVLCAPVLFQDINLAAHVGLTRFCPAPFFRYTPGM